MILSTKVLNHSMAFVIQLNKKLPLKIHVVISYIKFIDPIKNIQLTTDIIIYEGAM